MTITTATINTLISQPLFLFFIGFLGMILHFLKSYQAKQLDFATDGVLDGLFKYYFKVDVINTVITAIVYIIFFFVLFEYNKADLYNVFLTGYGADSLLNKASDKGPDLKKS